MHVYNVLLGTHLKFKSMIADLPIEVLVHGAHLKPARAD